MIRSSSKSATRRKLIVQLDALARHKCFERDRMNDLERTLYISCICCQRCYALYFYGDTSWPFGPEWAHVFSRRDLTIRWELDNNLTLCHECHEWFDNHKVEALAWFEEKWPQRFANIRRIQQSHFKLDLKLLLKQIKAEKAA
jgi:hypothetical protein